MFRLLNPRACKCSEHPTINALIAADFAYSRRQAAFDALARRDMDTFNELTGDKSDQMTTIPTDAARSAVCDRKDEGPLSPPLVRVPTPQQP